MSGGLRLFRFAGIDVHLHWAWLLVAVVELQWRRDAYDSLFWNAAEYVGIFVLVLLHEFGHALACRSVGGQADRILLWPLGGVAYVKPPPRPGAILWSIVAGPLVNLVLFPVLFGLLWILPPGLLSASAQHALTALFAINLVLLVFNLLPIYPLDGGQIVWALLWFVMGRERSLLVAATIGLVVSVVGGLALLLFWQEIWLGLIAAYAAWRSWQAVKVVRLRSELLRGPRDRAHACPGCGESPPVALGLRCEQGHTAPAFAPGGVCPECGAPLGELLCIVCEQSHPPAAWAQRA